MDFKTLMKFNERYKDYKTVTEMDEDGKPVLDAEGNPKLIKLGALDIFNDFLAGKNEYDCIVKILSCACKERDLTEDELNSKLSFDFPTMKVLDLISSNIIQGSFNLTPKKDEIKAKKN